LVVHLTILLFEALLGFSAPAWTCAARDQWIGMDVDES
jgi:hypothetical protein